MYKKDVCTFRLSNVQDGMLIIWTASILPLTSFSQTQFMLVEPRIIEGRSRCFLVIFSKIYSKTNSSFHDNSWFFQHKLLVFGAVTPATFFSNLHSLLLYFWLHLLKIYNTELASVATLSNCELLYLITDMFMAGALHYVTCCERRFAQISTCMRGVREECHKRTDWVRALRARTNREACRGARCGSDSADNGRIKWQDALDCLVWTA